MAGVAATMSGQSSVNDGSSGSSNYIQTSKLVGSNVKSSDGEQIGVIRDVVIDRTNGCTAYTVVSTGSKGTDVTGDGSKMIAVPWTVYSPASDGSVLTIRANRDKIDNAPAFEYARIDEYARPDYLENIYSYYGVRTGPGSTAGASTGTKPGTDATGTAGATASPGEVASPAPIATVAPAKIASERMQVGSAASADVSTTNPSRKRHRSGHMPNATPEAANGQD